MSNCRTEGSDGDLDSRAKIDQLVRRFYGEVALDDVLGPVFNDVAAVDWEAHIPKLAAFWRRALLGEAGYVGNPYREHARVHSQAAFEHRHFERWLELFEATVAGRWSGPNTDRALELVHNVARVHEAQLVGVSMPEPEVLRSSAPSRS